MDKTNSSNTITNSKEHPFGLAWLDSSYLETLLPGSPWQNVNILIFFKNYNFNL